MQPVSDRFLASLRQSHLISSSCTLIFPDGSEIEVPVEAGSVTIDRTAQNRRSGSVTIPWSLESSDLLGVDLRSLTLGGYCRPARGLHYPEGGSEEALLGVLRVESVSWQTFEQTASLELADRMSQIRDEPFTTPFAVGGFRLNEAAAEIVHQVFGDSIDYHLLIDPDPVLADAFYTGSRADALNLLASAGAAQVYFDGNGDFVFAALDTVTEPDWSVDASASGVMINASETLDRTGIFNGVLVQGQNSATSAPFSILVTYDEPTSPARWGGPFGHVATILTNTAAQDETQATAIAQAQLAASLRQTRQLALTAAPNPALEAGDTIQVVFPDARDELHLIDAVQIDLSTGAQSISTRAVEALDGETLMTTFSGADAWREARDAVLVDA